MSKLSLSSLYNHAGLGLRFSLLLPLGSWDDEPVPLGLEKSASYLHPGCPGDRSMGERP